MSIAVNVSLQPPLPIIATVRIICSGFLLLAVAVWFGLGVEMMPPHKTLTIAVCVMASFYGIYYSNKLVKSFYISISSRGSIALTTVSSASNKKDGGVAGCPEAAELMTGTTVWSGLILLRLQIGGDRTICIPVMKGVIDEQSFRRLAVACKWILRQNDPAQCANS